MARWAQDIPQGLAGLQVPTALCGFLALAQERWAFPLPQRDTLHHFQEHSPGPCVPCVSCIWAKDPKDIFRLM